ncbi:MAG: hypothetical protein ABR875_02060 [Minisyncoccia bacterium]|jgi:hypothetical protein
MGVSPTIKIINDPIKDADAFVSFIWHKYFIQNREKILKTYPELTDIINSSDAEKKVRDFVVSLHQSKGNQLEEIIKYNQEIINKKNNAAFKFLSGFMNYSWSDPIAYNAYLSLLPFSPFKKDYFFYSVLAELNNKNPENKSVLSTAIHEISHIIFLEYIEKMGWKIGQNVSKDVVYVLQESITSSMFKNPELLSLFNMPKSPRGNPEIVEIHISEGDNNMTLVDFVDKNIIFNKNNNNDMNQIINKLIKLFASIGDQISKKIEMWHKFGYKTLRDQELLKKFRQPIVIE